MGQALHIATRRHWEVIECGDCGIAFAVGEGWIEERQATGAAFYCPNGHGRIYRETTVQRLQKALAAKDQALASLDQQLHREQQARTRLNRRISRGVCPCCHRTVQQLARHMATQHPHFVKAP